MAIFGPLYTVRQQLSGQARFAPALAYAEDLLDPKSSAHLRIRQMTAGSTERIELTGGAFAIEQVYQPKARSEAFFESHRKYIDVQVIVEGGELMEVEDISRLVVTDAYNAERDLIKYADPAAAAVLRMHAGAAAIFFPADGHMPSLHWRGTGLVRKTVVKVPA